MGIGQPFSLGTLHIYIYISNMKVYLCVLVEHQHFQRRLSGVVEPFLCWTEGDSPIEVVINEGDHVDVKVVENLIFRFKCSGIHESQRVVTYLIFVV